eukprot:8255646-Pyramimonas_sp.AAC.2
MASSGSRIVVPLSVVRTRCRTRSQHCCSGATTVGHNSKISTEFVALSVFAEDSAAHILVHKI